MQNKKKIFNDPVYGFITIPYGVIFDLIEHPYFQRLRRIQQLGLTNYVYTGATHSRFQHAMGAMHLMGKALNTLKSKGHEITDEEAIGVTIAILLHDIGHGPFSHTLERTLVTGISHEELSVLFMNKLNEEFDGQLSLAIKIFQNQYHKKFLHQLVSSQLDMDRMDYLNRDSFFTGVYEGVIGYDRIIEMLNVSDDNLVIEAKGIYSIEKFIISRRLMYWQVYLHKTVLAVEQTLVKILERAKELAEKGEKLEASETLNIFLNDEFTLDDFKKDGQLLSYFANLDDYDIFSGLKSWISSSDKVLSTLCRSVIDRQLLKIKIQNEAFSPKQIDALLNSTSSEYGISKQEASYLVFSDTTSNSAYNPKANNINILYKDGSTMDITEASDQLNISVLSDPVVKHYLCYPKGILSHS